jgi:hypothetical protein
MLTRNNLYLRLGTVFAITIALALLIGCSLKKKGTAYENIPPLVFFANIPNDSASLGYNPVAAWYGTDIDGYIIEFQYVVVKESDLGGVSPADFAQNFPDTITDWIVVEGTRDTIQLYADTSASVYIKQYLFLRAKDDDQTFSSIKFRTFSRNNHPPATEGWYLLPYKRFEHCGSDSFPIFYCLPELSDYFRGIAFEWSGSDTMDYPGDQPAFQYHWALYGPHDTCYIDTAQVEIYVNDGVKYESYDSTTGDVWVTGNRVTMAGLRSGYYLFMVRARDDAFVPDPTPAAGLMHVVEPLFISDPDLATDIAFVDLSHYDQHPVYKKGQETVPDSLRGCFYRAFAYAGVDSATQVAFFSEATGANQDPVPFLEVFNYKLLIVTSEGYRFGIQQDKPCQELYLYLRAGGMVWIVGRQCFKYHNTDTLWYFEQGFNSDSLAARYLDLETSWFTRWIPSPRYQTQEFIGASASASNFPDLSIDSSEVARIFYGESWDTTRLPGVERFSRGSSSETLYKFISGKPEGSSFHGWPVASRREGPNYRCSYFAFPLHYIKQQQVNQVMSLMLDWFFTQPPSIQRRSIRNYIKQKQTSELMPNAVRCHFSETPSIYSSRESTSKLSSGRSKVTRHP